MDQSSHSRQKEIKSAKIWSPKSNSSNLSKIDRFLFSPAALSPPIPESLKLKDSDEFDDHQLMEEAKKAIEFEANFIGNQIGLLKDECKRKVEALRRVKIEAKKELSDIRKKYDQVQHQVGFNEEKAELLARENEVSDTTNLKLQNQTN